MCLGVKCRLRPGREGGPLVVVDRVEAHVPWVAVVVELDRRHEGRFVLRATIRFARVHPAEHGIVGEHHPVEQAAGLAPTHRFEQLVLDPPGRGVGDAEMALQGEGGDVVLVLGDQVDRLEPLGQRGSFEA